MCSIIGSFSSDFIEELVLKTIDNGRGCHSYSITRLDAKTSKVIDKPFRFFGLPDFKSWVEFEEEENIRLGVNYPENIYTIFHVQAPTTEVRDFESIHPAQLDYSLLWHNGILKPETIEDLQSKYNMPEEKWDTKLLLRHLLETNLPEDIDGSFACLFYNGVALRAFRNEIAPLFVDDKLTICSLPFKNSKPLEPNTLFHLDLKKRGLVPMTHFKTVENPYWMPE